ncbi:creatininase family protein [Bryobacter aggregatus]|uniref:creatininase family protein n=1 Tax=Bryobacter aggregatus TaxID=360054 RepID=UPI0009B5D2DF|nr:creatininase family protein [Bryobacter aggregatus]
MNETFRHKIIQFCLAALLLSPTVSAQLLETERMTWVEIKDALQKGKTTVLVFNGGIEQRGPQNVTGGHNLIARYTAIEIAKKLGNALVAPTIPFSPNRADPNLPGTIGLSTALFASLNEEVTEQLIKNGFKTVVLMGDHGGGQKELKTIAEKLTAKYQEEGTRVLYCDDVYNKANNEFFEWLDKNGYPPGTHASIPDTSEMLYIGGDSGWVRKELIATALGDAPRKPGEAPNANEKRVRNGISGDARRSTPELGKRFLDLKVDLAVKQIRSLSAASR